jgi:acyl-coenzyme A thioesterase PaaI-like protein
MNIQEVPFNRFLGIQETAREGYILELTNNADLSNHLGTIHAGALFSLAEATSGEFLLRQFHDSVLDIRPVVRKVDIKYSRPSESAVYSTADFAEHSLDEVYAGLKERGKVLATVKVELYNETHDRIALSNIHWFLALVR